MCLMRLKINLVKRDLTLLTISTFYQFIYYSEMKGSIKALTTINGLNCHTFFMKLIRVPVFLPETYGYQ